MTNHTDHLKAAAEVALRTNEGASWFVGYDVLLVTLNESTQRLTQGAFQLLEKSLDLAQREGRALVLNHEGSDFSAGEDWPLLYGLSREGRFGDLEQYLEQCYQLLENIRSSEVPFVLCAEGRCLGMASRFLHLADSSVLGARFTIGFEGLAFGLPPLMGSLVDLSLYAEGQKGSELRKATLTNFEKLLFAKLFSDKNELQASSHFSGGQKRIAIVSDAEERKSLAIQEAQWLAHSKEKKSKPQDQIWLGGLKGWSSLAHQISLWEALGQLDECRRDLALGMAHVVSGCGVNAEGFVPRPLLLEAEKALFLKQIQKVDVLERLGQALGAQPS
jgi:hypothetical protein